ncbi:MAG: hypothetical protein IPH33_18420 [Bacteroidetes bacterium]|nr:hypothetical protein [Bacteroidota bacterium]
MTLHEAIDKVLSAAGKELSAANIAEEINRLGLYKRSDISPISSSQILSRATKYPDLFSISKDKKFILTRAWSI